MHLFNAVDDNKNNTEIMGDIFSHPENCEIGASILFSNWNKWNSKEEEGHSVIAEMTHNRMIRLLQTKCVR